MLRERLPNSNPSDSPESPETLSDPRLVESLEKLSNTFDFDLSRALKAGEREFDSSEVLDRAREITEELELDDGFFADSACAITLLAAAESSVAARDLPEDKRAEEEQMLVDALFAISAKYSPVIKKLAETDDILRNRYFERDESPRQKEYEEFFESHIDHNLSKEVLSAMKGDFLNEVRESLGVTCTTETPFDVKVIKMESTPYSLQKIGAFGEAPEYPPEGSDYSDPEVKARRDRAIEYQEKIDEAIAPYAEAHQEYQEKFADEFGNFVAFCDLNSNVLYLSPIHAYSILEDATFEGFGPRGEPNNPDDMQREAAAIKHEYVHSQKIAVRGAHAQLGLAIEERRAELLSGDNQGYEQEKGFFTDLAYVTDRDVVGYLSEASKSENPYASFVSKISNSLGMRTALLILSASPANYQKNKEMSGNFIDLEHLKGDSDRTLYDTVVGQAIARFGEDNLRKIPETYLEKGGYDALRLMYEIRGMVGFGSHRTRLIKEKLDELDSTRASESEETLSGENT